jgi:hypothetical protein
VRSRDNGMTPRGAGDFSNEEISRDSTVLNCDRNRVVPASAGLDPLMLGPAVLIKRDERNLEQEASGATKDHRIIWVRVGAGWHARRRVNRTDLVQWLVPDMPAALRWNENRLRPLRPACGDVQADRLLDGGEAIWQQTALQPQEVLTLPSPKKEWMPMLRL